MNKRPVGTRLVPNKEQDLVLEELNDRKKLLNEGIQNMSVTLYTNRAQREMKGYVAKMDEVDRNLTVYSRPRVYIAE